MRPGSILLNGREYPVIDEVMVTGEYLRTVKVHGVTRQEWATYSYVSVVIAEAHGKSVEG